MHDAIIRGDDREVFGFVMVLGLVLVFMLLVRFVLVFVFLMLLLLVLFCPWRMRRIFGSRVIFGVCTFTSFALMTAVFVLLAW